MPNNSNGVVVSRNTDTTMLQQMFGREIQEAQRNTQSLFDVRNNNGDEPDTYIPIAGVSTRRGSRPVLNSERNQMAEPIGSPASIIYHEAIEKPWLRDPKNRVVPEVIKRADPSRIINKADPHALSPMPEIPTQENSIPKELKEKMQYREIPSMNPQTEEVPTMIQHPRQYPTEPIPSRQQPEPPFPPRDILPPVTQRPVQPTEDMIVKVLGYNESNMKLLSLVSDNTSRCAKMLSKINDTAQPIDVNEIMSVLEFMDNSQFRQVLSQAFQKTMEKNQSLYMTITSYLNGTAKIETEPKETPKDTSTSASGTKTVEDVAKQEEPKNEPPTETENTEPTKEDSGVKDAPAEPTVKETDVPTQKPSETPVENPPSESSTDDQGTPSVPEGNADGSSSDASESKGNDSSVPVSETGTSDSSEIKSEPTDQVNP